MARNKVNDGRITVKQDCLFNLSFVAHDQIENYVKYGYQHLMVKVPSSVDIPTFSAKERVCLKILMEDKVPKEISAKMCVDERATHLMLQKLRHKFGCRTNAGLVIFIYKTGLNNFL